MSAENPRPAPQETQGPSIPEGIRLKKYAVSQFELELPAPVNKTACGLATLASVVNYVGPKVIHHLGEEIIKVIKFDRRTVPFLRVRFAKLPEVSFPVTRFNKLEDRQSQIAAAYALIERLSQGATTSDFEVFVKEDVDRIYRPTFSIETGTDARGVVEWLEQKGFQSALLEYNPSSNYQPTLKHHYIFPDRDEFLGAFFTLAQGGTYTTGKQSIPGGRRLGLMTSIRQSDLGYPFRIKYISDPFLPSTHQVLAIPHPTSEQVYFLDPAMTSNEQRVFSRTPEEFTRAFCPEDAPRAHFTAVWR